MLNTLINRFNDVSLLSGDLLDPAPMLIHVSGHELGPVLCGVPLVQPHNLHTEAVLVSASHIQWQLRLCSH